MLELINNVNSDCKVGDANTCECDDDETCVVCFIFGVMCGDVKSLLFVGNSVEIVILSSVFCVVSILNDGNLMCC